MNVYVATTYDECPAALCLRQEGIQFTLLGFGDDLDYGRDIRTLWEIGEPFILIEHDICPWPGSVDELQGCDKNVWCAFGTVRHQGPIQNMEMVKITPEGEPPPLVPWNQLDGVVVPRLVELYGVPHVHTPPVAHARTDR